MVLALASVFDHGTSTPAPQGRRVLGKQTTASTPDSASVSKPNHDGRGFLFFGMPRIFQSAGAVLAAGALFGTSPAAQADWPDRPITSINVDIYWSEDGDRYDHITNWTRDALSLKMTVNWDNPNDLWVKYCFDGPGIDGIDHRDDNTSSDMDVEGIAACPGWLSGGYWFDVEEYSSSGSYTCMIMEKDPDDPGNKEKYTVVAGVQFYLGMSKAYVCSNRHGYDYYVDISYNHNPWPIVPDEVPDEEEENDLEDDYYGYVCYPVYGYTPGDPGDRYWVK